MGGEIENLNQDELNMLLIWLNENNVNETENINRPSIKHSLRYVYPLIVCLNAMVVMFGTVANMSMVVVIIKKKLYTNPTFIYLANIAISDIVKTSIVLPLTVMHILMEHWIFGSFMCFFLPMMHSIPIHVTMLSYVMIGADRYRQVMYPMKARLHFGFCLIAIWLIAICVVLPYAAYIRYFDIGSVLALDTFNGFGICIVNMDRHIEEYIRAMFVTLYCLPLAVITYLYVKVAAEIKAFIDPQRTNSTNNLSTGGALEIESSGFHHCHHRLWKEYIPPSTQVLDPDEPEEINLLEEKKTQKYIITMVILFAVCWCPINLLNIIYNFVYENHDTKGNFDITYVTLIFFGFLSTCINPILFASWQISLKKKNRWCHYLQVSLNNGQKTIWQAAPHSNDVLEMKVVDEVKTRDKIPPCISTPYVVSDGYQSASN